MEHILSKQRYLAGSQLTEADIRMFVVLIRFDIVYYFLKCTRKRISSGKRKTYCSTHTSSNMHMHIYIAYVDMCSS